MTWNWQQPDWPHFSWDGSRLRKAEERFLVGAGVLAGTLKHLPQSDQEQLTVEVMSAEAVTTSEIEGEILDRASVQSSIRRHLGLPTDRRRVPPAEEGISEMMVDLYRSSPSEPDPLPALTRAGIAHLYFESIHPFEDGNGRIGRAISEKALAQAAQQGAPIALAATILARRKGCYAVLEASNKDNEATQWLRWFAGIAIEAQRRTTAGVEFLIDKTK